MENDPLDIRRRRALFRAMHRGTKEMDWFLGRYAAAHLDDMDPPALQAFEELLSLADPDLNNWILNPALIEDRAFDPLIEAIRTFHGLADEAATSAEGVQP